MDQAFLEWISAQQKDMTLLLENWVNINSHSFHLAGLHKMIGELENAFGELGGAMQRVPLPDWKRLNLQGDQVSIPLGQALHIVKHPDAAFRVLLAGHMDTVYPASGHFQTASYIGQDIMLGPGVSDMKGGLVIMHAVLKALEMSSLSGKIGWEVIINPDEELGSPGAGFLYQEAAQRVHAGMIFEPALADGSFVKSRKGSFNFAILCKGKAAHAGRDFHLGKNAITGLARFLLDMEKLNERDGVTVNAGLFEGGVATNVVPEYAIARVNIRMKTLEEMEIVLSFIERCIENFNQKGEGTALVLQQETGASPKIYDPGTQILGKHLESCGNKLGIPITWGESGGVSDGSRLASFGIPNLDSFGVIGAKLHTPEEFAYLPSLVERARLAALFLMELPIICTK
jgi:glutamate carboxypeptidase